MEIISEFIGWPVGDQWSGYSSPQTFSRQMFVQMMRFPGSHLNCSKFCSDGLDKPDVSENGNTFKNQAIGFFQAVSYLKGTIAVISSEFDPHVSIYFFVSAIDWNQRARDSDRTCGRRIAMKKIALYISQICVS